MCLLAACGGGDTPVSPSTESAAEPAAHEGRQHALAAAVPTQSQWSAPVALTLVPASAANLPNGKVLLWSAQGRFDFITAPGSTYTALFDPVTGTVRGPPIPAGDPPLALAADGGGVWVASGADRTVQRLEATS